MIRSHQIEDRYKDGTRLRVWSITDAGQARCLTDGPLVADLTAQEVSDQEAANAAVRASIATVEAYEAAVLLSSQEEPPATISVPVETTEDVQVTNPAHAEWVKAGYTAEQPEPQPATFQTYEWTQDENGEPVQGALISETPNPLHVDWQAAVDLAATPEPAATITETRPATVMQDQANPAHAEWVAAGEAVAAVSPETLTLAQKRAGTWVDPTLEELV